MLTRDIGDVVLALCCVQRSLAASGSSSACNYIGEHTGHVQGMIIDGLGAVRDVGGYRLRRSTEGTWKVEVQIRF